MALVQVNMVKNGDFESGTLEGWVSQHVMLETSRHLTGAWSALFMGQQNSYLTQVMPWNGELTAELTFSATAMPNEAFTNTPQLSFALSFLDQDKQFLSLGFSKFVGEDQLPIGNLNNYKNFYAVSTVSPPETRYAVLNINSIANEACLDVLADDIQLVQVRQV
ncbi:NTTRR-F1 domain [Longirhabdus pacifica]|uniref:NTTRR-F1 domain n=1 Tax=Longirhabdus pacifica TaxID=2305227 RepID=UPI0010088275|nr:NTTRR-F1 domain [Longirhabdus pacifica]